MHGLETSNIPHSSCLRGGNTKHLFLFAWNVLVTKLSLGKWYCQAKKDFGQNHFSPHCALLSLWQWTLLYFYWTSKGITKVCLPTEYNKNMKIKFRKALVVVESVYETCRLCISLIEFKMHFLKKITANVLW